VTQAPLSQFGASVASIRPIPTRSSWRASVAPPLRPFSRDGGSTWTKVGGLPGNFGSFSPSVAFDAFGNCFLALVHDPDFGNPRLELFVSTADDDRKQAPVSPSPRS
jgi:hypothetical protein